MSEDYKSMYSVWQQVIKDNYATFEVPCNGEDNNDYVDGEGLGCNNGSWETVQTKGMIHTIGLCKSIRKYCPKIIQMQENIL